MALAVSQSIGAGIGNAPSATERITNQRRKLSLLEL